VLSLHFPVSHQLPRLDGVVLRCVLVEIQIFKLSVHLLIHVGHDLMFGSRIRALAVKCIRRGLGSSRLKREETRSYTSEQRS